MEAEDGGAADAVSRSRCSLGRRRKQEK